MSLDRRHKWTLVRKYRFRSLYLCLVCGRRGTTIHNLTGLVGEVLKKTFTAKRFMKAYEVPDLDAFEVVGRWDEHRRGVCQT